MAMLDGRADVFVSRWREILCEALDQYGGFQWSINSLYRVHAEYRDVLRQHVGIENPSPFKRAAAFAVAFMGDKIHPIYGEFKQHPYKYDLRDIDRYAGSVLLYEYSRYSLHGAELDREDGVTKKLEKPFRVSKHTYIDMIHAISHLGGNGGASFHLLALLLEQLAYQENDNVSYERLI